MKVVLDTNVWISSLLSPQSIPSQIVKAWHQGSFNVVILQPILNEIKEVLVYPKINKRLNVTQVDIENYLSFIHSFTEFIELESEHDTKNIPRDIDDLPILLTLLSSKANYLITGDKDYWY